MSFLRRLIHKASPSAPEMSPALETAPDTTFSSVGPISGSCRDCGAPIERTGQRGRPPVRCAACRAAYGGRRATQPRIAERDTRGHLLEQEAPPVPPRSSRGC